jgi:hypothetical protein
MEEDRTKPMLTTRNINPRCDYAKGKQKNFAPPEVTRRGELTVQAEQKEK